MASKISSLALFLALNILFFTFIASACETGCSSTTTPTSSSGPCPIDTLKLKVCANLLGGLLNVRLGQPATEPCCSLIQGLADLDAAVCLCTAIKANVLGINLNVPVDLSLLLNNCGYTLPRDFQCA